MTDLHPVSALGHADPKRRTFGAMTLAEIEGTALASLAPRAGTATPAPFGLALPGPGLWVEADGLAAFWTGPGQWLLQSAEPDLADRLRAAASGCSVTDQGDAWATFEMTSASGGAPVAALLERLVNLPPAALAPGHATRTLLEHLGVFVIRRAEDRLAILGMRSAADSLWHSLSTALARQEDKA